MIKGKKTKEKSKDGREREGVQRDFYFLFFIFFVSFSDLWKLDHRFSLGLKAKLIHVTRATREYQNLGISSNSTR